MLRAALCRRWASRLALSAACLATAADAGAQSGQGEPRVALLAYTMRFQPAAEVPTFVAPLLSPLGSVEVRPDGRTLLIRDTQASLRRLVPRLRAFDHPVRALDLEVQIVRADAAAPRDGEGPSLPPDLAARLRDLLSFQSFRLLARDAFGAREGAEVSRSLDGGYQVGFRIGTVLDGERLRLHGFRVLRRDGAGTETALIHTTLMVHVDRPTVLGLARSEESPQALMVVLECAPAGEDAGGD